jgi:hypothetical protein
VSKKALVETVSAKIAQEARAGYDVGWVELSPNPPLNAPPTS